MRLASRDSLGQLSKVTRGPEKRGWLQKGGQFLESVFMEHRLASWCVTCPFGDGEVGSETEVPGGLLEKTKEHRKEAETMEVVF